LSRPLLTASVVALTAGYALGAAATTPFSVAADVVTAVPILLLAVAAVVCWPLHPQHPSPPPAAGPAGAGRHHHQHPFRPWVAVTAAVAVWELVEYLAPGSRGAHPTLSSMADAVDRIFVLKALVFFGWIWLCILILRSGRAAPRAAPTT
jgi:ABC-type dipeptide/oligopeptide/nickel transport system permease subunit